MRWWKWFLAYFRLDLDAVCEMSRGRGRHNDYHDWPDSRTKAPWHGWTHVCERCGKKFTI